MKNLLRSHVITVEIDSERWNAPGPRRLRRIAGFVLVGLTLYGGVSLFTMMARSPFQVAVERAAALGGWEPTQVHFDRGYYGYRFFYSVVRADLQVDTPEGRRPVRIRLRNDPFSGWTVLSLADAPLDPGVVPTSINR